MSRPPIPTDIRRAVLVEAGHRCAIPRCGQTELDVHHIVPWETCQKHEYSNLIALCPVCHRRAHNGQIDRKSLFMYKEKLAREFGSTDSGEFKAEVIETRRRISEHIDSSPGYHFNFDFPDFLNVAERIVSRNIEAWGYELLVQYRERQEMAELQEQGIKDQSIEPEIAEFFSSSSRLIGDYRVVRRDEYIISVKYEIYRYYTGAAHGGVTTRVQNFLLKPFSPLTLEVLLGDSDRLPMLADFLRGKLEKRGLYDTNWLGTGTEAKIENFERFNIENYGIRFTFDEYQIDSFSAGKQELSVSFDELASVCDPDIISRLRTM